MKQHNRIKLWLVTTFNSDDQPDSCNKSMYDKNIMWQRRNLLTDDPFCSQLMKIMVKVSDISNEARPMEVAEPWLDCLLQEFFNQVISTQDASGNGCVVRIWTCEYDSSYERQPFVLVLLAERHRETQRPPGGSLHGPGQSVQTVLSDQLHPVRPPAALQRAHQALPLPGGKVLTLRSKSDAEQRFKGLKFCCHVVVQQHILEPVRRALEYYSDMERAAKEEEETRKTWGGRRAADSDQSASWNWNIGSLKCV